MMHQERKQGGEHHPLRRRAGRQVGEKQGGECHPLRRRAGRQV